MHVSVGGDLGYEMWQGVDVLLKTPTGCGKGAGVSAGGDQATLATGMPIA